MLDEKGGGYPKFDSTIQNRSDGSNGWIAHLEGALGGGGRHGTVNAVSSCLVVGCCDDASSLWRPAYDDWFADQLGPIAFLNRGVEGIHVDVEDHGTGQSESG